MSVTYRQIMAIMNSLAPMHLAESWDNVGLLVGSIADKTQKILLTLDVDMDSVAYALNNGYGLIITHHPFIFKPLSNVITDQPQGKILKILLSNSVGVFAAHTNLDIALGGVNDVLAQKLNLIDIKPLTNTHYNKLYKLSIFVPREHYLAVKQAVGDAGAGRLGNYSHCTFASDGIGSFKPLANAKPFIGVNGQFESVEEVKMETVVADVYRDRVLNAMHQAHPYEEVAYDLILLENKEGSNGLGRIGKLSKPCETADFLSKVKKNLNVNILKIAGETDRKLEEVAVCGGSGAGFIEAALRAGADVLVTGDVKYHEAQKAIENGLLIVDAGHFHTEQPVLAHLQKYLQKCAQQDKWLVDIDIFQNSDVFNYY